MTDTLPARKKITIVTHNSSFHTDDIFGVATLCLLLEQDHEIKIVRSREREVIDSADFVVDTGDEYNAEKNRFDHHQTAGAGVRENGVPYASFGLVWKKYGEELCGSREVSLGVEKNLVLPIDARDNGIDISKPIHPNIFPLEIRDVVDLFRNTWKEPESELYNRFCFLVTFAKEVIKREIIQQRDKGEAKELLLEIYKNSDDKRLLMLDTYYPFSSFATEMPEVSFVVYPDMSSENWCIKTVRNVEASYNARKDLPAAWGGKRHEELEKITGVSGAVFCHKNRFLAVAKTKEAILKLAELALNS